MLVYLWMQKVNYATWIWQLSSSFDDCRQFMHKSVNQLRASCVMACDMVCFCQFRCCCPVELFSRYCHCMIVKTCRTYERIGSRLSSTPSHLVSSKSALKITLHVIFLICAVRCNRYWVLVSASLKDAASLFYGVGQLRKDKAYWVIFPGWFLCFDTVGWMTCKATGL